jgi:hypothetical protein
MDKIDNVKDSFYKELEPVFNKNLLDFNAKVGREKHFQTDNW